MKTLVFVGNSLKGGISIASLDARNKLAFAEPVLPGEGVAPLAIHPNRRFLYAVVRTRSPHEIVAFAVDSEAETLRPLASIPVPASIVYLAVDPAGLNLLAASYSDGEVLVHALSPDGPAQLHPLARLHPERNPHGINATADGKFVFVPALGHDRILQYSFDAASGTLTPNTPPFLSFPRNAGPRHLAFSPDRRQVYALMELSGTVDTLGLDPAAGVLTRLDSVPMLPPGRELPPSSYTPPRNNVAGGNSPTPVMWAADIGITPDGRFVYASERTNSTISCFRRDPYSGRLDFASIREVDQQPRSFALDPRGTHLFVAGEKSGTLGAFALNGETGELSPLDSRPVGEAPNWVAAMLC